MLESIGRYKVLSLIGEGAMAEVYKAYDPRIDRTVALKILKRERCLDKEYVDRFLREAKAAGALSHPNIVTVYDVGQIEERPYIMMELLEGQTLETALTQQSRFPLPKIISIALQLAEALDYAHGRGVVHRDIKPSNIILLPDRDRVKIADFGIARMAETEIAQQTQMGMVLGTPRYMSPEQVRGQQVDGRSDLFSVGVVIYQLLAGDLPFPGKTLTTLLMEIAEKDPVPLAKLAPDVPPGLQHIVGKLLAKTPTRRFQSGAELARSLSAELRTIIEEAEEKSRPRYIPMKLRWSAIMALIIALITAGSVATIYNRQASAMLRQLVDFGASLSRFIAAESAISVLSEDWVAIESLVTEVQSRQSFRYLAIVDHQGVVRAATDAAHVGEKINLPPARRVLSAGDDVRSMIVDLPGRPDTVAFETPITFQDKEIGRLYLGLSQDSVQRVSRTSLMLMIGLGLVSVLGVVLVTYGLAQLIAKPIKVIRRSMVEVAAGNADCRISQRRSDEFGDLFAAFNSMMTALQLRLHGQAEPAVSLDATVVQVQAEPEAVRQAE
ncbi:MAG TPA: protein kinase [Alphaproteobacteria bacterium]|nr:protein kinase [Alphaproteobacteria bacterium]